VGDHSSLLAFIEKRFLSVAPGAEDDEDREDRPTTRQHLTKRDQHAHTLEDMFDFDAALSMNTTIVPSAPPAQDCTSQ
jgi:hypothetical protein